MKIFNVQIPKEVYMPIIIVLVSIILEKIIKAIIKGVFNPKKKHVRFDSRKIMTIRSLLCNITRYGIWICAILGILSVFGINTAAIITGLGVVSLVIGLAFQDILKDILVGISIIFEGQYAVGDLIKIDDFVGKVLSIGLKSTRIQGWSGEILIISNRNISKVINYSLDNSIALVDIPVAYEEDLEKVERTINEMVDDLNEKIPEIVEKAELLGVQSLSDSSVVYRLMCKCKPGTLFSCERKIRKEAKVTLDKHNIKIPYTQIEVHNAK